MSVQQLETIEQGYSYGKRYCSRRETPVKDMKNRLIERGLTETKANRIIKKLIEENYINEKRYATLYTQSKIRQNHWGKIKIKRMLMSKGIKLEYINEAFATFDQQEYLDILRNLFEKKLATINIDNTYQRKYRLEYYLSSHGFESDLIDELCKEYL